MKSFCYYSGIVFDMVVLVVYEGVISIFIFYCVVVENFIVFWLGVYLLFVYIGCLYWIGLFDLVVYVEVVNMLFIDVVVIELVEVILVLYLVFYFSLAWFVWVYLYIIVVLVYMGGSDIFDSVFM